MDLLKLGKKSIMVPTPGQAEQEYVATHLQKKQLAYTVSQSRFNVQKALAASHTFPYQLTPWPMEEYKNAINEMLSS